MTQPWANAGVPNRSVARIIPKPRKIEVGKPKPAIRREANFEHQASTRSFTALSFKSRAPIFGLPDIATTSKVSSFQPHLGEANAVREQHKHHPDDEDRGRYQGQRQAPSLVPKMHEVGDDQRRLDDREGHEQRQHHLDLEVLISQRHFSSRKGQEPPPHKKKNSLAGRGMRVPGCLIHETSRVKSFWLTSSKRAGI